MLDTISPPEFHSTPNPVKENSAFSSSPTDVPLGGEAKTIRTPLSRGKGRFMASKELASYHDAVFLGATVPVLVRRPA